MDNGKPELKPTSFFAGVALAAVALTLLVVVGCGDDAGERVQSLPSPAAARTVAPPTNTPAPPTDTLVPPPTSTPEPTPTNTAEAPPTSTPEPPPRPVLNIQFNGAPADLSDQRKSSLADLIESVQAGVVQITTSGGSGSGFILTADGLVVTNEHVVAGTDSVGVWLTSGRRYDGDVLERDAAADLALVRIDSGDSFDAIPVGNPDDVRMGDEVLALGFPIADRIGNSMTVTRGIVSSIRTAGGVDLLQTDAALNPGNSVGPLVNDAGEVVGINTSRIEDAGDGRPVSDIGFAVSVIELERRLSTLSGRPIVDRGTATPTPTITPTPTPTLTPTLMPTPTITPVEVVEEEPLPEAIQNLFKAALTVTPTPTPTLVSTGSVELSKVKTPSDVERIFGFMIDHYEGLSYECQHKRNVGGMKMHSYCNTDKNGTEVGVLVRAVYSVFPYKVINLFRALEISSGTPILFECFGDTSGEEVSDCGIEYLSEGEAIQRMREIKDYWEMVED